MKNFTAAFAFLSVCCLHFPTASAKGPNEGPAPGNSANARSRVRPQLGPNRLNAQATPRTTSPSPGRGKALGKVAPAMGLARRQKHQDTTFDGSETTHPKHGFAARGLAKDAPRIAMTRALSKRLSQIDKIRDKALETEDLGLLELADQLELRARRKYHEMTARMDQRRELGKPGIGPPVVQPVDDPTTEPVLDTPGADQPIELSLPDSDIPVESNLPVTETPVETELPAETETPVEPESEARQE